MILTDLEGTCGDPPGALCRWVFDRTESDALAGVADFLVDTPLQIALILVLAWVINRLVSRGITRLVTGLRAVRQRRRGAPPEVEDQRIHTITGVLRTSASAVIWTITALTILEEIGFELSGLVAGATVAGAAVAFGAQALVRDFLSGFFMLVEDQFVVGDHIDVGMTSGQVEKVTLRITQLRDDAGTVWYVPNGRIDRVANKTQGYAAAVLDVGVAHGTDLARASEVIADTVREVSRQPAFAALVLSDPIGPDGVEDFDADKVVLRVSVRVVAGTQWDFLRALRARLLETLPAAGVGLPVSASEGGAGNQT